MADNWIRVRLGRVLRRVTEMYVSIESEQCGTILRVEQNQIVRDRLSYFERNRYDTIKGTRYVITGIER